MKQGDFTQLAKSYKHRVGYSRKILETILETLGKDRREIKVCDVGAGTGKLTKDLADLGLSVVAVEPNKAMREQGQLYTQGLPVEWRDGSGESTGLESESFDWVLMGSSFHWVALEEGLREFHRILVEGGAFTAIWNPRDLDRSELQRRIDSRIKEMVPSLSRVSSGNKKYSKDWTKLLASTDYFKKVKFLEGDFDVEMSRERYLGIWDSVNDIRAQAGQQKWQAVRDMIDQETKGMMLLKMPYKTRSWTVYKERSN